MKKIITLIVTAILSIACVFGLSACGDEDVLKIGVTDYAPMDYKENQGCQGEVWVGFDADLAKEVGKILGKKIEFVEINWNNKILSINSKEIDIIWNGMTITEELQEALTLSSPYLENNQVIVCQKTEANKYTEISDLSKAGEILVEAGSAGESAVLDAGFSAKMTKASAQKDTLLEVKTSAQKVAVIDKLMAQVLVGDGTSYSDLTFVEVGFSLEQFGIGFRKEDVELKNQVENAIAQLKASGKVEELQQKYFK